MVPIKPQTLTLAEFLALPEEKPPQEYGDGQITIKPMPKGKHSALQTELSLIINGALKRARIAWAFTELRCTFEGRSIVPDIAIFTWENIPRDQNGEIADNFYLAPNWTIEILSPDQSQTKVIKNILFCLNNGAEMGWLIDPKEQSIFVYQPGQSPEIFDDPSSKLPAPSFAQAIDLTLGEVFGWLTP
ncbi:MAG: Uma2 family endonuclease [Cyanobacteria bacterium RI_101]|nr:Uma2 family endonuclease [Cyanobacteria bacterium RI_101]